MPYLLKNKFQIFNFMNIQIKNLKKINIHILHPLREDTYIKTILENSSKILTSSRAILKNKSNFKL
jgi:hypothetical protein